MDRRRVLRAASIVPLSVLAGCQSADSATETTRDDAATTRSAAVTAETATATATETQTESETAEPTETPGPEERTEIYVDPSGSDDGTGSEADPLASIQTAFEHAYPGDTIHALPGDYTEAVRTRRSGESDAPITLTGPPEAVLRGNPDSDGPKYGFHIEHSNIHLRGLTFNGLHDPDNPDDPSSYVTTLINARHTPISPHHYHRNLVIKPHAVGNTLRPLIHVMHSEGVEIGEFVVIGPAGLAMERFGDDESHNGEIVYLGTAPDSIPEPGDLPDSVPDLKFDVDRSNDIHVHHIDNSQGHPHAELVDIKGGCENVLVEYCTDAGGAAKYTLPSNNPTSETSIHVGGRENTVRWNVIEGSHGQGIEVGSWGLAHKDEFEAEKGVTFPEELYDHGRANSIYGNRIVDYEGIAIQYPLLYQPDGPAEIAADYGPDEQTAVCGNEIDGETHGSPGIECSDSIPTTGTIGHLGGDSPWRE